MGLPFEETSVGYHGMPGQPTPPPSESHTPNRGVPLPHRAAAGACHRGGAQAEGGAGPPGRLPPLTPRDGELRPYCARPRSRADPRVFPARPSACFHALPTCPRVSPPSAPLPPLHPTPRKSPGEYPLSCHVVGASTTRSSQKLRPSDNFLRGHVAQRSWKGPTIPCHRHQLQTTTLRFGGNEASAVPNVGSQVQCYPQKSCSVFVLCSIPLRWKHSPH